MNLHQKTVLANALLHVSKRSFEESASTDGICDLFAEYIIERNRKQYLRHGSLAGGLPLFIADRWLNDQFREWPEFSGSHTFPVPAPEGWDATPHQSTIHNFSRECLIYCDSGLSKWDGEYGASRRRLLAFLLEQIAKEL